MEALQLFVASHLFWLRDIVVMNRSYLYISFDNRRPGKQHSGGLVTNELQTQLCKNTQRTKNKKGTKDKQKTKDEQQTEDKQGTKGPQEGKEIKIDKVNELDEPNESRGSNCLFVPIIYI